jgi:hypothetical protein
MEVKETMMQISELSTSYARFIFPPKLPWQSPKNQTEIIT